MHKDGCVFFPLSLARVVGIENGDWDLTKLWSHQTSKNNKTQADS